MAIKETRKRVTNPVDRFIKQADRKILIVQLCKYNAT